MYSEYYDLDNIFKNLKVEKYMIIFEHIE